MPTRLTLLGWKLQDTPTVRRRILIVSLLLLALLVLLEWLLKADFSLGILYTFPVAVAALVLTRRQVLAMAVLCAIVRGQFTPYLSTRESVLRFAMATIAYAAAGLLVVEVSNNRRQLVEHFARLDLEQRLRRKAEDQLRILVESSPAAILTIEADGTVAAANRAAHEMFGCSPGALLGAAVEPYFPVFVSALALPADRPVRSSVSGWGRRSDGQMFPVQAWFSTYGAGSEHALAAILVDMSEEVRERERENFRQLVDHHRLLAGAVSHEIRNLCSAASVVCANLAKSRDLSDSPDFDALRRLVAGLTRIASIELRREPGRPPETDLKTVVDQLLVVVEPDWSEIDGRVIVQVPADAPAVVADPQALMQIFLNLTQNSCRAVAGETTRELRITAEVRAEQAVVRFEDSGRGVADQTHLFQPFREEADGTGLGLYVSRALARSFGGDLVHVPTSQGCRFDVLLPLGAAST
ncbi:MAG: PAS domain S-box protein [Planctomycetales bacterium]|nr:PAS domain S-box protein [Planctomycetales bacterium]MBN8624652.1 PAS domain S-box protein [Planctomycetota bacterium]